MSKIEIDLGNTKGVSRKLDCLGRIVLPKEFRDELNLDIKDELEIFLVKNGIFLLKK